MDKCNDVFHSIEKKSSNTSTKDEHAIQNTPHDLQLTDLSADALEARDGGETHLHANTTLIIPSVTHTTDERFRPIGTTAFARPTCNPADIMPRLIKVYKTQIKYAILLLSLITIGVIIASSFCFVSAKQNEAKGLDKVQAQTYGIITAIISFILLIGVCALCNGLRNGCKWMNNVLRTIQLDDRIWQYQVDSLQNTVPKSMLGFCVCNIHGRLRMRPNGHIVLTEEGLIIDEFIAFRYKAIIVLHVDLINNVTQTGWILRVFLVTRHKSQSGRDEGRNTRFQVDLFMPPYMQIEEATDIRQLILSNSHKYLVASKFYVNPQVNRQ